MIRGVLAVAAVALVAAAGGASESAPPPLDQRCGSVYAGIDASVFWFQAADGATLDGALLGEGEAGVVLASEYPADLCGWLDYAVTLRKRGFRVLAFDFRGLGESPQPSRVAIRHRYARDVVAAVAELRRRGASRVALVGASLGGTAVLVAAPRIRPAPAAVVSLSGEWNLESLFPDSGLNALPAVRRLHRPLLLMVARQDRYLSVKDAKRLQAAARSRPKRLIVYPGSAHGWDLLSSARTRAKASGTLVSFLRSHTARSR